MLNIQIRVPEHTFIKDPEGSELGKSIIRESIYVIDQMGLEAFNFKKLAAALGSTEASIYRYFENKHKLLLYLSSWYWSWLEYQLVFGTANIEGGEEQLSRALDILVAPNIELGLYKHIDFEALHRIAISESPKSYFSRNVDDDNKMKLFDPYKSLIGRLAEIYEYIQPDFPHAHSLAATVVDGILHQSYYAAHLPTLNDIGEGRETTKQFFYKMSIGTISQYSIV